MMVVPHVILTISSKLIDNINFVGNAGGTMRKLVLFGMVGVLAQLIDGALGMAYGLTSTTLLVAVGTAPAVASATVHLAELGTTAVSGVSTGASATSTGGRCADDLPRVLWRLPGGGGAVLAQRRRGQAVGGRHPQRARRLRAVPVPRQAPRAPSPGRPAAPLGVLAPSGSGPASWTRSAAAAGARWGPRPCASGRMEPRKVIGSVDTGEFLVALGASLGFLVSLTWSQVPLTLVLLLLAGGLVAAPWPPGWSGAWPRASWA